MPKYIYIIFNTLFFLALASISHAQIDDFVGDWENIDENTKGMTRLTIKAQEENLVLHGWGKCNPTDCDWEETKADAYGTQCRF